MGSESVIIFFVMSGYLVGGSAVEKFKLNTFDLKKYFVDRLTRLYTPVIPAMILAGLIKLIFNKNNNSLFDFIGDIFGLQGVLVDTYAGNGPLWSLGYEIWFYVLAGALLGLAYVKNFGWDFIKYFSLVVISLCIFTKLDCTYLFTWFIGALTYCHRDLISGDRVLIFGIALVFLEYLVVNLLRRVVQ
jgi:peptidoglycan/LPS O-acetylase OafA/YrhL